MRTSLRTANHITQDTEVPQNKPNYTAAPTWTTATGNSADQPENNAPPLENTTGGALEERVQTRTPNTHHEDSARGHQTLPEDTTTRTAKNSLIHAV